MTPTGPPRTSSAPLEGLRVIDASSTLSGPLSTLLLAQWGAEVIKIEPPSGDVLRGIGDADHQGLGPVFLNVNRGKRSVVLDLKSEAGRAHLHGLVAGADVFVHNMRPRAAERLGLTGEALLAVNPRLVHVGFRGYGSGGPLAAAPAYDDVIQAGCGLAATQGGGGDPEYVRSSVADKIVGLYGAAALLASVREQQRSGQGAIVEIPMMEVMSSFMLIEQQGGVIYDPPRGPAGYPRTESPYRRPHRTSDGHIAVMIYNDKQWANWCRLIGREELIGDPRFASIRERTVHSDEFYALVGDALATGTTDTWLRRLAEAEIPAGHINTVTDLLEDPQLVESGFFEEVEHPRAGRLKLHRLPGPTTSDPAAGIAPSLGEHTDEVLHELLFSTTERRTR